MHLSEMEIPCLEFGKDELKKYPADVNLPAEKQDLISKAGDQGPRIRSSVPWAGYRTHTTTPPTTRCSPPGSKYASRLFSCEAGLLSPHPSETFARVHCSVTAP